MSIEAAAREEIAYAGPPVCAECGKRHAPGLLHSAGCPACKRDMLKGLIRRESVLCSHRCQQQGCGERQRMRENGYLLSAFCQPHDPRLILLERAREEAQPYLSQMTLAEVEEWGRDGSIPARLLYPEAVQP